MPSRSRYIANFIVSSNDVANASITYSDLGLVYTDNVTENVNLYYTNARVYAAVTSNLAAKANVTDLTTANVTESTNLYFTNARVYAAVTSNLAAKANVTDLTTSNVTEGTNLYFTNARVTSNVIAYLPNYTGNVGGNLVGAFTNSSIIAGTYEFTFDNAGNVIVPNAVRANILYANTIQNLTTSNLTEGTNLYFTNTRAYANTLSAIKTGNGIAFNSTTGNITLSATGVTAGTYGNASILPSLTVDSQGRITSISNITIGTSSAIETTQTFTANGTGNTFVLTATPTTANTLVFVDGLLQFPTTHYTFTGNTILFTDSLQDGESIYVVSLLSGAASILSPIGGLTPGIYGNATIVPTLTLDTYGRVTNVSNSTITASNPDDAIIFSLLLSGM